MASLRRESAGLGTGAVFISFAHESDYKRWAVQAGTAGNLVIATRGWLGESKVRAKPLLLPLEEAELCDAFRAVKYGDVLVSIESLRVAKLCCV